MTRGRGRRYNALPEMRLYSTRANAEEGGGVISLDTNRNRLIRHFLSGINAHTNALLGCTMPTGPISAAPAI